MVKRLVIQHRFLAQELGTCGRPDRDSGNHPQQRRGNLMAHSMALIGDDTFRFSFLDLHGNQVSVPLTRKQVDEYRDVLDLFSTKPLKKEHKKLKEKKLWSS